MATKSSDTWVKGVDKSLEGQKVVVTQIRSFAGRRKDTKATMKALGLTRIGRSQSFTLNGAVYGMLRKVQHLVRVEENREA